MTWPVCLTDGRRQSILVNGGIKQPRSIRRKKVPGKKLYERIIAMKNIAKEILTKIEDMKSEKARELEVIFDKAKEAGLLAEKAEKDMRDAYERLDLAAYEKAKNAKATAETAAEMYGLRGRQLEEREFLTEEESDATIDALKGYEEELAFEFKKAIEEPIRKLSELQKHYAEAVTEAELAIKRWTSEIHRNYRSEGTRYPDGSNRSPVPIPVRNVPYSGCGESAMVESFLNRIEKANRTP